MRERGDKEGKSTVRDHLQTQVERGREDLREQLEGPDVPEVLEYLWRRLFVLDAMRGVSMEGAAPFTPEMILAADRLFGWELTPAEVLALRELDGALRHPGPEKKEADAAKATPAWPQKKGS